MKKILVVDDEAINRTATMLMLKVELSDMSVEIVLAEDGDVALEMIRAGGIHCMVTDNNMPRMMGSELVEQLRREGYQTPIIMVTGDDPDQISEPTKLMVQGVFYKPVNADALVDCVRQWLMTL